MFRKALYNLIRQAVKDEINNTKIEIKADLDDLVFYRRENIIPSSKPPKDLGAHISDKN